MEKRLPEFDDLIQLERFRGADYREAEEVVVYTTAAGIRLRDLRSGKEEIVTAGGRGEGNARFSPDGSRILFTSAFADGQKLFLYERETKSVHPLTTMRGPVMEPLWSPDGTKILFASPSGAGGRLPAHRDSAVVIEDFGYKFDGMGFYMPTSFLQLFVVEIEGGKVVRVTDDKCNFMHHNWASDSRHILCCSNLFRSKEELLGMDLLYIEAKEHGEIRPLTQGVWLVSYPNPLRPIPTPDGKAVLAGILDFPDGQKMTDTTTYPEVYLYKIPLDGSEMERIFFPGDTCYQCVQFPYNAFCGWGFDRMQLSDDGQEIFFHAGWQGRTVLYGLPTEGGTARTVLNEPFAVHGIGAVQNGKALLAISSETRPERYVILDTRNGRLRETGIQSAEELTRTVSFSQPENFFVNTLDGDGRIHGWVMPPQRREEGKRYPAILYIHGGPHPFYTYGFTLEHQCFAAAGFAVLYCNPRGSSGYGKAHQDIRKAFDGRAYEDCLQFVDEACRRFPWIDPDRIGVTGGSYGGYMTNYMATHSKRFRAYVSQRSVVNQLISYASSDMQGSSKKYRNFEEFMIAQLKDSPVSYAERIDRPFLILHGTDDLRTPVEGAHQLFVAIKDTHPDLPVCMVLYPHTGHDQPSNPKQQKHYYHEMLNWFRTYL